jgi:lipooligosaccharide transport system ATP-binding protein
MPWEIPSRHSLYDRERRSLVSMKGPPLEIKGLSKRFGARHAVENLDITLQRGECLGLLGPNGAGKSTTIKMLLGLATPTSGSIRIFGLDIATHSRRIKRRMGVVPQNDNLDPDLTVEENLFTYASYFGLKKRDVMERITSLLDFIAMENRRKEIIQHLSGGQRRRLLLARALINDPDILILDEPTVGLDPQARKLIWERLSGLAEQGVTMLVTSHYIEEIEVLADNIIIIDKGRSVVQGNPSSLVKEYVGDYVVKVSGEKDDLSDILHKAEECGMDTEVDGRNLYIYMKNMCSELDSLLLSHTHFFRRPANLEDVFLRLTGRTLRES